ncbi:MAG: 2-hydroxyacid dehydrogenase [Verrucomicrobiota bacterium]
MRKVVYLGPEHGRDIVAGQLGDAFQVECAAATPESVGAALRDAEVFVDASMKVPLTRALLEGAPNLKLVITATTGADHIDSAYLQTRGIPLLTLKGQQQVINDLTPAAELSWMLLMACARKLRPAIHHVEQGHWNRELFPGVMLKGKTLGLVGCGRIGKWMSRYAHAFDMQALGFDPYLHEWPEHLQRVELPELLRRSDFISIHVHLTDETRGLIGAKELALVRPGTILINTARGAVVDEDALLAALEDGRIGAFGFDVLEGEPNVTQTRLWQYAQKHLGCVITPHIGGFSPDALAVVLRFTAQRIADFFKA